MSYHSKSDLVKSILKAEAKKAFTAAQPYLANTEKEKHHLVEQLKSEMKTLPHVSLETNHWQPRNDEVHFKIRLGAKHVADPDLQLSFDQAGCLRLKQWYGDEFAKVSALAEITAFAERLQNAILPEDRRREKLALEAAKRKKVRNLKEQAIFAKIKALCEAEKVDYFIDKGYRSKVKLLVRLSKAERMEVDIPLANYQNTMQNVRSALQSMRELFGKGVLLKVKTSVYDNQRTRWISVA